MKKRRDHGEKNSGIAKGEKEDYTEFRDKLDKATQNRAEWSQG